MYCYVHVCMYVYCTVLLLCIFMDMYLLCIGFSCSDVTTTVACALPHKEDYATDDL